MTERLARPQRRRLGAAGLGQVEQITAEYRRLALLHHPDKHGDTDPAREAAFRAAQEAYDCLRDPQERRLYDTYLAAGLLVPFAIWRAHVQEHDHPVRRRAGAGVPKPGPARLTCRGPDAPACE